MIRKNNAHGLRQLCTKKGGLKALVAVNFMLAALYDFQDGALGATITNMTPKILSSSLGLISINVEIVPGDCVRFIRAIEAKSRVSVFLQGPGGDIEETLCIGAEIHSRNFATDVLPETECLSACGLIWLAGPRRYMDATSRIGFHAAYRIVNGKAQETGMGNADIGAFLNSLGISRAAIRFITSAPPDKLRYLTIDDAKRLDIKIYEHRGTDIIVPE